MRSTEHFYRFGVAVLTPDAEDAGLEFAHTLLAELLRELPMSLIIHSFGDGRICFAATRKQFRLVKATLAADPRVAKLHTFDDLSIMTSIGRNRLHTIQ